MIEIKLIPRPLWGRNLRARLSPERWRALSRQVREASGGECACCGQPGDWLRMHCHENWSYDDRRRVQKLVGLQAVCERCHLALHVGYATAQGRRAEAVEHYARVNGLDPFDAEVHIEEAFEVWRLRSQHDWTQDYSWFESTYGPLWA